MDTPTPVPPTEAARQYLAIRKLAMALNDKLIGMKGTVHPLTAARALGMSVQGKTICFDEEWELSLLSEYTLFYHLSKGKRFFERALLEADDLSPAEREILACHKKSFASVFEIEASRPHAWEVDLFDVLGERGRVTIMDRNFSRFQRTGGLFHSRLIPHGHQTVTSGAVLPLLPSGADKKTKETVLSYCRQAIANPGKRSRQQALLYTCRKLHLQLGPEVLYE